LYFSENVACARGNQAAYQRLFHIQQIIIKNALSFNQNHIREIHDNNSQKHIMFRFQFVFPLFIKYHCVTNAGITIIHKSIYQEINHLASFISKESLFISIIVFRKST
jgi:hypothetical protein